MAQNQERERGAVSAAPRPANSDVVELDDDDYTDSGPRYKWDQKRTRFTLAYSIIRNHKALSAGDKVTLECSKGPDGEMYGPEADHFRQLLQAGVIAGTPQARDRAEATAANLAAWGAKGKKLHELRPITDANVLARQPYARGLTGDPKALRAMERQEARETDGSDLIAAIKAAVNAGGAVHAGAEAPGSAKNPDGSPVVVE